MRPRVVPDRDWEQYWWDQWRRSPSNLALTRVLNREAAGVGQRRVRDRTHREQRPELPDDRNERRAVLGAWKLQRGERDDGYLTTDVLSLMVPRNETEGPYATPSDCRLGPALVGLDRLADLVRFLNALERQVGATKARDYADASLTFVARVVSQWTSVDARFPTIREEEHLFAVTVDDEVAAWCRIGRRGEPEIAGALARALSRFRSVRRDAPTAASSFTRTGWKIVRPYCRTSRRGWSGVPMHRTS